MVQLLFARLPQFKEEFKGSVKKLTMRSDASQPKKSKKTKSTTPTNLDAAASASVGAVTTDDNYKDPEGEGVTVPADRDR